MEMRFICSGERMMRMLMEWESRPDGEGRGVEVEKGKGREGRKF